MEGDSKPQLLTRFGWDGVGVQSGCGPACACATVGPSARATMMHTTDAVRLQNEVGTGSTRRRHTYGVACSSHTHLATSVVRGLEPVELGDLAAELRAREWGHALDAGDQNGSIKVPSAVSCCSESKSSVSASRTTCIEESQRWHRRPREVPELSPGECVRACVCCPRMLRSFALAPFGVFGRSAKRRSLRSTHDDVAIESNLLPELLTPVGWKRQGNWHS